jgi:hypothetical protein
VRAILHELALPAFRRFARRWGYAVLAEELSTDGASADPSAQQAKWAKVRLLREALAAFLLALWLDADILVMRDDEDVAPHLHPDHFQAWSWNRSRTSTGSTPTPGCGCCGPAPRRAPSWTR